MRELINLVAAHFDIPLLVVINGLGESGMNKAFFEREVFAVFTKEKKNFDVLQVDLKGLLNDLYPTEASRKTLMSKETEFSEFRRTAQPNPLREAMEALLLRMYEQDPSLSVKQFQK